MFILRARDPLVGWNYPPCGFELEKWALAGFPLFDVSRGLFGPSFGRSGCAGGARRVRDTPWKLSVASTEWTETAEEGIFFMGVDQGGDGWHR